MLWKRNKIVSLFIMACIVILAAAGCSGESREVSERRETVADKGEHSLKEEDLCEAEKIAAAYRDIYDEAVETNTLASLETKRRIVIRLGENGYAAVDSENQIDMAEAEQVLEFCQTVEAGKEGTITIVVITDLGFRKFDLETENGSVNIVRGYYQYEQNGSLQGRSIVSYPADLWQYTKEGYLIFEGSYFSDENFVLTLSDTTEHTALRVLPLEETCRKWNRKYILSAGYERNNLFLTDWNEDNFGDLNFYDIFDIFYPVLYQKPLPYTADKNLGVGAVYQIPEEIFENVIMTYFKIDKETLRQKTTYIPDKAAYEYRPRGFYEAEYPDIPYPEVVDYIVGDADEENPDGTITLIINAVYSNENTAMAFSHRTVIRPLENGAFQYVSNQMIFLEDEQDIWWHTNRLTEEEWKAIYGESETEAETETDSSLWFLPQTDNCLLTEAEKEELKSTARNAAEQVKEVYKEIELIEGAAYGSNIKEFTKEQCREAVTLLGRAGYVSVTEDTNMENYEKVEEFYVSYTENRDAMVTIFNVNRDGLIGAFTFIYRNNTLQTYYVGIGWREGGIPEIKETLVSDIAEIKLTEKGYFIYAYEELIAHSSLRQYWRIKPLSDKCRELTAKYVYGLSYVNYNVLVTNWDGNNVEEILTPCMFEDIYRIDTGENLKTENGRIPADTYERIMTTYFPVTIEQLRENCGYDENSGSYEYEMIFSSPYPPFGEVVDYTENPDGTITLIVDGVWADYNSDLAFTNIIVVEPFADGTFRYLSNSIEPRELEVPKTGKRKEESERAEDAESTGGTAEIDRQMEKGYDLPIDDNQRKEAEDDCKKMMGLIADIYKEADKGSSLNGVISDETMYQMAENLKSTGYPVITSAVYAKMENYEELEDFLNASLAGGSGSAVVYEIHSDGGISRYQYLYDGKAMYILSAKAAWSDDNNPMITSISYTRLKEWKFTQKGWFCYQLCVPEYPEVTEVVDGSYMLRVKPILEENREISEKCVLGLAYQGNNLLCSDWDAEHMENLDYNGMYEYLYAIKYQKRFPAEDYPDGIPKDEFESLLMEYLPITAEEIQRYAVFDEENQTYVWERLGCFHYTPTYFGTSVPEVTDIRKNEDGTLTLTVDAVCSMILCDDAVITHELTIQCAEDGSFRYLGNKILDDGIFKIPEYQYRVIRK